MLHPAPAPGEAHRTSRPRTPAARAAVTIGAAAAAYGAAFAALFAPGWAGRIFGPGDGAWFFLPAYAAERARWTDTLFGGYPLYADPQIFQWYPPALALRALGVPYDGFAIAGFVLCAAAAFALAWLLTGSRAAAAVAGIAYGLSGFVVVHAVHPTMVHAAAWTPAALAAVELIRRREGGGAPGPVAGLALAVALLWTAGSPQLATYGTVVVGAYGLARAPGARRPLRVVLQAAAGGALGLALAAVQLVPAAELSRLGVRESLDFATFAANAYRIRDLVTVVIPSFYGGGDRPYLGPWDADLLAYFGIGTLLLAAAALARPRAPAVRFFVALGIAGTLLALGPSTPLARLVHATPVLGLFRGPTRHFVEVALALAVLAAAGVVALREAPGRARRLLAAAAAVVLLAIVAAAPVARALKPEAIPAGFSPWPWANPAVLRAVLVAAGSAAALLVLAKRPSRVTAALAGAILLADLALFAYQWPWKDSPPEALAEPPPGLAPLRDELRATGQRLVLVEGFWDPAMGGNLSRLWDVPSLSGYSVLALARVQRLASLDPNGKIVDPARAFAPESLALDALAVRYVLAPAAAAPALHARLEEAGRLGPDAVLRNPRAMPRAWLVPRAVEATDDAALAALHAGALPDGTRFGLRDLALVAEGAPPLDGAPLGPGARAEVVAAQPERLVVETESDRPALLVTSDVHYPGWRARLDGAGVPVLRANVALRAVAVPAGRHVVTFTLEPVSLAIGGAVSAAAAALVAALAGLALSRARRDRRRLPPG